MHKDSSVLVNYSTWLSRGFLVSSWTDEFVSFACSIHHRDHVSLPAVSRE